MILFEKRFHEGLTSGAITLTFRSWKTPRVKPGQRYRCHPIGVLEVDEVAVVEVGSISERDAASAGFGSRAELLGYIADKTGGDESRQVVRVGFHHAGDGDRVALAMETEIDDATRRALAEALARLDDRGKDGPWTNKTLALISRSPRVAASQLAAKLGRDTKAFKADVVKLKKLGLTQSFEVGYEISPRGRAYLERPRRASSRRGRG
ncbi:MAG: hypothetical protein JNL21_22855 [Myxococcales bacterium]|nr:hypothetical protein [Myxococcales bacterium]